ncbi:MAG: PaaI family thioesterase [Burkholderiales bacterium]
MADASKAPAGLGALASLGKSLPSQDLLDAMGFMELVEVDPQQGVVRAHFDAQERFCHTNGTIVQGGFVTAWLDFSMAQAAFIKAGRPVGVASLEIKVSFLRRVGPGRVLAEGRVTRMGRRVAFLDASLFDSAGVLLATASSSALLEG